MSSVSVIIPCYNSEKYLSETIESALHQGALLKEIILVDDRSVDNTFGVIEEYSRKYPDLIKGFRNPQKGGNHARNYGFEQSTGEYIQWLDSDDILLEGKFKNQIATLESSGADVTFSDLKIDTYKDGVFLNERIKTHRDYDDFLMELLKNNWSSPNNYLLKRELASKLHEIKAWNPERIVFQDREYMTMAAIIGGSFVYTPGVFAIYNVWSNNSVAGRIKMRPRQKVALELYDRFEKELKQYQKSNPRLKEYICQLDTTRLFALIWFDNVFYNFDTHLFHLKWKNQVGVKIKFLMFLKYWGMKTDNLASKLLAIPQL